MKHIFSSILIIAFLNMCSKVPTPEPEKQLSVNINTTKVSLSYGVPMNLVFTYKDAAGALEANISNLPEGIAVETDIKNDSGKFTFVSTIDDDSEYNTTIVFFDGKTEISKSLKLCTVKKEAPKSVTLAFAQQDITIHDASVNQSATLSFTLENATADTQVTVTPVEGLDASATIDKDLKGGVLTVKATGEFTDGCKLAVTASNGAGNDIKEVTVNKYYLALSCGNENVVIDNDLRTINYTTYKDVKDVQISISTNLNASVTPVDNGWLKVTNQLLLSFAWNDKQEARSATLTIKGNPGNVDYIYTVSQAAGVDEFALEKESLIELWKALDGPNWKDRGSLGNCWAHNWNTELYPDAPLEDWYGVELWGERDDYMDKWEGAGTGAERKGHVRAIVLFDVNVRGELPECIKNFRYLEEFDMNGINGTSHLKGKVPNAFGKLPLLRIFDIGYNEFEENLENSAVKDIVLNCPRMERLGIDSNNFTGGVPEWLAELKETHQGSGNWGRYDIAGNRLEGKVPEKVKNHWQWQKPWLVNYDYKTWGEYFMKNQQPGYILYE